MLDEFININIYIQPWKLKEGNLSHLHPKLDMEQKITILQTERFKIKYFVHMKMKKL